MSGSASSRHAQVESLEARRLLCIGLEGQFVPSPHAVAPALTSTVSWQTKRPIPQGRFEGQGTVVGGKLYVLGGFTASLAALRRSDVYDPTGDTWTRIADMPEPITHAGQTVDGTLIYVAGGFLGDHPGGSVNFVRAYNTATNTWANGPSLPDDRGGGALVRLGRELHYFGGGTRVTGNSAITDVSTHWVLDLGATAAQADDAAAWTAAPALPNPRNHIGGAAVGGRIYAVGGQHGDNESGANQTSVHAYTAETGWVPVADLPRPLGHLTASTFEYRGRVMAIGGVTQGADEVASVIEYDPPTNTWVALPSLPGARQSPVAGAAGATLMVSTGEDSGAVFSTTWTGVLETNWETAASSSTANMPVELGEVSAGVIGNKLYVVGQGNIATLRYDLSTNQWASALTLAVRQYPGNHHAAEVVNGKLYLFGGLDSSSGGRVQIFDPSSNRWTLGAPMPFAAGSSSSALINGEVYVAGGIVGSSTTTQVAKYNPVSNTWTTLAPMPQGRNHTASGTDGRRLFIFGGRGPGSGDGNVVANGFNTVQIYDPATNTWQSSLTPGSTLAPLPQARGGMGKAVFVNGEFYVMGGETLTGPGATERGVYHRVDVYNPATNTWRLATEMPTARHGIFPVGHAGRIYVAGGGVQAAGSRSNIHEVYNPNDVVAPTVAGSAFHFETAPLRVTIRFSEDVSDSLDPADLSVSPLPSGPAFAATGVRFDAATRTATFALPTPLPDGDYRATLSGSSVSDASANNLGSDIEVDFFTLAGDANRDRRVDVADVGILASNWQQSPRTFSQGNFSYSDDVVDVRDVGILASNWGQSLAGLALFRAMAAPMVMVNHGGEPATTRPASSILRRRPEGSHHVLVTPRTDLLYR